MDYNKVKKQYPLIEQYAVSKEKLMDFFQHFSKEQLDDFEDTLHKYFIENSIVYDEMKGLTVNPISYFRAKESYSFNGDILRLACGMITYEDFIDEYTEHTISNFDLALPKVMSYFRENEIKNLMDYGCDTDEGLHKLSSMYKELLDKSNIPYFDVSTRDKEGSDGKFITTISFDSNTEIEFETEAWNGLKAVTNNMVSVYDFYSKIQEISKQKENENEIDLEVAI